MSLAECGDRHVPSPSRRSASGRCLGLIRLHAIRLHAGMETREREAIGRARRAIGGVVVLALLAGLTPPAGGSDPPRLGVLMMARSIGSVEPFVDGLRALGHVDGRTVVIQWRVDEA